MQSSKDLHFFKDYICVYTFIIIYIIYKYIHLTLVPTTGVGKVKPSLAFY